VFYRCFYRGMRLRSSSWRRSKSYRWWWRLWWSVNWL